MAENSFGTFSGWKNTPDGNTCSESVGCGVKFVRGKIFGSGSQNWCGLDPPSPIARWLQAWYKTSIHKYSHHSIIIPLYRVQLCSRYDIKQTVEDWTNRQWYYNDCCVILSRVVLHSWQNVCNFFTEQNNNNNTPLVHSTKFCFETVCPTNLSVLGHSNLHTYIAYIHTYTVAQKSKLLYFCNNFVDFQPTFIIVGIYYSVGN